MPSSIKNPNLGIRIVCKVAERIIFLTTSIRALKGSADPAAGPRTSWSVQGDKIFQLFPECRCPDILLLMWMSSCPDLTMIQKTPAGASKEQRPIPGGTLGLSAGGGVVSITTSVTTIYLCTIFVNRREIQSTPRSGSTHRRDTEESAWLREVEARPGSRTDVDSRRFALLHLSGEESDVPFCLLNKILMN